MTRIMDLLYNASFWLHVTAIMLGVFPAMALLCMALAKLESASPVLKTGIPVTL